jgi:hypothetical protein
VATVTRQVSLVEQGLVIFPEHMSSPAVLVGFILFDILFSVKCFVDRYLSFYPFSLDFVLFVLDYSVDIF